MRFGFLVVALSALCLAAGGCKKEQSGEGSAKQGVKEQKPLRMGFFPNITHGQALVGNASGAFQQAVPGIEMKMFNAGPAAMEALSSGSLDVSYVGTGPAINTFLKGGRELRVIAAAADSGAVLVTKTARTPAELKGKTLGTPQLGNTQDIALRHWLGQQGMKVGQDVTVTPLSNPDILGLFLNGRIEGAWVPEPWGARMVAEGGGHILLDERDLWPERRFHTTVLVTTQKTLKERPEQLKQLLRAHVELTRQWQQQPEVFVSRVNEAFGKVTGHPISEPVLKDAFSRLQPALEVNPGQLQQAAEHARQLGFISSSDLSGLVDDSLLREVMSAQAQPAQRDAGP
ncbi:NitT/TauT family transport system substrate-binding protein [Archangium gephyra]|uniref:ABC-type sulfate transporter, periplasmic binding protein n=1 Tax=Archangium gephyra TaxID=48 RepID=A0AAC8Q266_9BACT|nr:ABC transporter substrate-binding protein [Archangium gephyra]AKI99617.1 ABC-type sulfate transporter, periplasmic binding protein [Archangium gephyra]REG27851.1 NitT/TauT family transport system substrate-binding protein [Archangium gephyra]